MKPILFIILFTLNACYQNKDNTLEKALDFAGANRHELEMVLEHYSSEPEKLEAACFLISNMPNYYTYRGEQLDSVYQILASGHISAEQKNKWKDYPFYASQKVYDSHVITADFLIENIDLAFEVWKNNPWNKSLKFDDFCELILPYRIADEPLSPWRKLYYGFYHSILDSTYNGSDVIEACQIINKKLKETSYKYNTDFTIPHLDAVFLFNHRIGYCREVSDLNTYAMRSCGIPVSTEYFIYSPDYQGSHSWNTLRDTTGQFIQFGFDNIDASRKKKIADGRKKGKVYRYCFGKQKEYFPGIDNNKRIPSFFRNRYNKDVTANYFGINSVTLPLKTKKGKYIYLGVFSPKGWVPIDIAISDENEISFHNIEPQIIYMPLSSDGIRNYTAGYPFMYINGKAILLKPDTKHMEEGILTRKMSIKPTISEWLYRSIIGARIEASNDPLFKNVDLLFQFNDTLKDNYYTLTPLQANHKYKYIRYVSPKGKKIELAEFSVFKDVECKEKVRLKRMNNIEPHASLDNVTDNNVLTYFISRDTTTYISYDLGERTFIKKIIFSPRNDDNYIWPGDRYELFYQDGINGWKSLGVKTAVSRALKYLFPKNSLLWLRNLTKGNEEQVFIYKNNKQIFVIDLK